MSLRTRLTSLEKTLRTTRPSETQTHRIRQRIEGIRDRNGWHWPTVPPARDVGELRDQIAAIINRRKASHAAHN